MGASRERVTRRAPTRRAPAAARPWLAAMVVLAVGGCAGGNGDPLLEDAANVRQGEPLPYVVAMIGVDQDLETYLRSVSEAVAGSGEPPSSVLALRRRASTDAERLTRALASEGYYDASVRGEAAMGDDGSFELRFTIEPGPRYRLGTIRIESRGEPQSDGADVAAPSATALGLVTGEPAVAQTVLDAEARLVADARRRGHHYAAAGERLAVIDRNAKTLDVTLVLEAGPAISLGPVEVTGIDGIDRGYVDAQIEWATGDRYSPEAITRTRRALVDTGLFQVVDIELPETPPADGVAPVTIRTEQRRHRTISGGVRFQTDAGPGGDIAWEHRNALGAGETFRASLDVDRLNQSLDARLRKPQFYGRDRSLLVEGAAVREDTDAFESTSLDTSFGVEQRFGDTLEGTLGAGLEFSEVSDVDGTERFGLLFVPAQLRYDGTDAPLDASRGARLRLDVTPFWDMFDTALSFQRFRLDGSTYMTLSRSPRLIVAARGALGSLIGVGRDAIPANRRFYAGGGGSVRGIPFQTASPLDGDDEPLGGRSLLELSGEVRYNISETIGVVGFVDAGRAFEASFPDLTEPLVVGAGLGARYYTPIGPLRVDVAVPVDQRDVDDPFQFYISLGQAF